MLYLPIIAFIPEYRQQEQSCYNIDRQMTLRLVFAIISTLLEEAALVVIVLWGLSRLGIEVPLSGLIAIMVTWGAFAVFVYRMGSRALRRKPVIGLASMIGSKGKVVRRLAPGGLIRIKDELWEAESDGGKIGAGEEVMVEGQDGLKLIVRKKGVEDIKATK